MSDAGPAPAPAAASGSSRINPLNLYRAWRNRLVASRGFQTWASRIPLLRVIAKREGEALFDLLAGFVHSQVLCALVELGVLQRLREQPAHINALAADCGVPKARMRVLLRAGAALGLVHLADDTQASLTQRGATLLGVPGLEAMISHNRILYRDLADPAQFFQHRDGTELAAFWPYVFGDGSDVSPEVKTRYSDLMADSQILVAEETLRAVSLSNCAHLLDIGGGSGAFLAEALASTPDLKATLFDLPGVATQARARFHSRGLSDRVAIVEGSFEQDPLPQTADTISLIRVLYDHSDASVKALLERVFEALPPGGRVIISEPMGGNAHPVRPGDTYFALYTLAMGTGKTRSANDIAEILKAAGFEQVRHVPTHRPFVTSVVTALRPAVKTSSLSK